MKDAAPLPRARAVRVDMVRRWCPALALAIVLAVLLLRLGALTHSAIMLIRYPFGVDYGEGIVWQQMRNMMRGQAYGPLGTYPAIVYHYPPLFHLTAAATSALTGLDGLAAGRLVSWISTLGTAVAIGMLAWIVHGPIGDRRARGLVAILAGLLFLGTDMVNDWSAMMRVDMLACLFGMVGLVLALLAVRRPWAVHGAALCFVCAIYTKQVSIAAPAAAFLALLAVRPALSWRLVATALALGLAILGLLCWVTGGGFLRHILLYNINRFRPDLIGVLIYPIRVHLTYLLLAAAGAVLLVRRLRERWATRQASADEVAPLVAALAFVLIKTAMLPMVMKSGANLNYLLEWFCAVAVVAALGLSPVITASLRLAAGRDEARISALFATALLGLVALQAADLSRRAAPPLTKVPPAAMMWPLVSIIRHTHAPVIADEMTLLIRAGREVEWEPAITAELGSEGRYDQAGFIRMVRAHRFGLFITESARGGELFDARYNPAVAGAMDAAYPVVRDVNWFTLHWPSKAAANATLDRAS